MIRKQASHAGAAVSIFDIIIPKAELFINVPDYQIIDFVHLKIDCFENSAAISGDSGKIRFDRLSAVCYNKSVKKPEKHSVPPRRFAETHNLYIEGMPAGSAETYIRSGTKMWICYSGNFAANRNGNRPDSGCGMIRQEVELLSR